MGPAEAGILEVNPTLARKDSVILALRPDTELETRWGAALWVPSAAIHRLAATRKCLSWPDEGRLDLSPAAHVRRWAG